MQPSCVARIEATVLALLGLDHVDVACKGRAATIWTEIATLLTGTTWVYLKVPQAEFAKLQPSVLSDAFLALS